MQPPKTESVRIDDIADPIFNSPIKLRQRFSLPAPGHQVMYVIRVEDRFQHSSEFAQMVEQHRQVKKSKPGGHVRMSGINGKNISHQSSRLHDVVFYVGTSKDFASRLNVHVGYGNLDTGSLCLRFWPLLQDKGTTLIVDHYDFGSDIQPESLKLMEFMVSAQLKPLIGHNRKT